MSFLAPVDSTVNPVAQIQYLPRVHNYDGTTEQDYWSRDDVMEIVIDAAIIRENATILDHFEESLAPNIYCTWNRYSNFGYSNNGIALLKTT